MGTMKLYFCKSEGTESGFEVTSNKSVAVAAAPENVKPGDSPFVRVDDEGRPYVCQKAKRAYMSSQRAIKKAKEEERLRREKERLKFKGQTYSQEELAKAKTFDELKKYIAYLLFKDGIY